MRSKAPHLQRYKGSKIKCVLVLYKIPHYILPKNAEHGLIASGCQEAKSGGCIFFKDSPYLSALELEWQLGRAGIASAGLHIYHCHHRASVWEAGCFQATEHALELPLLLSSCHCLVKSSCVVIKRLQWRFSLSMAGLWFPEFPISSWCCSIWCWLLFTKHPYTYSKQRDNIRARYLDL